MWIPFINYPRAYSAIKQEVDNTIGRCLERGDLIYRPALVRFENRFAVFHGALYGIGTGSCSGAMFLALKALGIGQGDEVITVAHTYIATIDVIKACGATPVLVDVEKHTMLMDMAMVEDAITERTRAIMPVHLNGRICNMAWLSKIVEKHRLQDIYIIEDAAQAVGAKFDDKMAGGWGQVGCFSFYPVKILGWYGEGGMAITSDSDLALRLYLLRDHGELPPYLRPRNNGKIYCWGYNSILDNIAAAVLTVKMRYLKKNIQRRRQIARSYNQAFSDLAIECPPYDDYFEPERRRWYDVFQNYVIKVPQDRRDLLRQHLKEKGIETMVHWEIPNHFQAALDLRFYLPVTEALSKKVLSLPMYPELKEEEVFYVIEAVRSFFG